MTSSKLILLLLGFIFVFILILSSNRVATALRSRFGRFFPFIKGTYTTISPTPTPTLLPTPTFVVDTPTPTVTYGGSNQTKGGVPGEIPSTGPAEIAYLLLGGSLLTGFALKKITS